MEVAETIWAELICCMLCKAFSLCAASRYEWGPWPGTCNVLNQIRPKCTDCREEAQHKIRAGNAKDGSRV